jgi:hypothetical protein
LGVLVWAGFALALLAAHFSLLSLPYYWDEAGHFIPTALDLQKGLLIGRSATPNIHPPGVAAFLAAVWSLAGFTPVVTRCAMLLLASVGLFAAFKLAGDLAQSGDKRDNAAVRPAALLTAALLFASPVFFVQSMLAQLDAPAMTFTVLALLCFLRDRVRLAALCAVALVMMKETGVVVPLVLGGWLIYERRWRDAIWFLLPVVALGAWVAALAHATGNWAGDGQFLKENVYDPLNPAVLALAFLRRIYYLSCANLHWIGIAAVVLAWRGGRLFRARAWKIVALVSAAHLATVTVLGGAVLNRYLLPIMPVLYAAMAIGIWLQKGVRRLAAASVLLCGLAAANFINPPYPFAYEDNLEFAHFVRLHMQAAKLIERDYAGTQVAATWPVSAELKHPELGYVSHPIAVKNLPDLSPRTLAKVDWSRTGALVVHEQQWGSAWSPFRLPAIQNLRRKFMGETAPLDETALPFKAPEYRLVDGAHEVRIWAPVKSAIPPPPGP